MTVHSVHLLLSPLWCLILAGILSLVSLLLGLVDRGLGVLCRGVHCEQAKWGRSRVDDCKSEVSVISDTRGPIEVKLEDTLGEQDLQLCFVPWGTITRSPALTSFSSPPTIALATPEVKMRCWSTV